MGEKEIQLDKNSQSVEQGIQSIKMDRTTWILSNCYPEAKIVDIGSNKGHIFENWQYKENVTFVDIDLYDIPNFVRADAHNLPFKDKQFDIAILAEILEHVEDPIQVLKEAKRVAREIIITTPNEYEWPPEMYPFTPAEKMAQLRGLTIEEMAKKDNPAKEFYTKDNYAHLHHRRYYTYSLFKEHLDKAKIPKYTISKLYHQPGDVCFWVAVCHCP